MFRHFARSSAATSARHSALAVVTEIAPGCNQTREYSNNSRRHRHRRDGSAVSQVRGSPTKKDETRGNASTSQYQHRSNNGQQFRRKSQWAADNSTATGQVAPEGDSREGNWAKAIEEGSTAHTNTHHSSGSQKATASSPSDASQQQGAVSFPALVSICRSWRFTVCAYNGVEKQDSAVSKTEGDVAASKTPSKGASPSKSLPSAESIEREIAELETILQEHSAATATNRTALLNKDEQHSAGSKDTLPTSPGEKRSILSSKDVNRKEGQLALAKLRAAILLGKPIKSIAKALTWIRDNIRRLSEEDTAMVFHDLQFLLPRVSDEEKYKNATTTAVATIREVPLNNAEKNLFWAVFNTVLGQFEASDRLNPISRLAVLYRCGCDGTAPSKRHLNLFVHEAQEGVLLVEMSKENDPQRCAAILYMANAVAVRAPHSYSVEVERGLRQLEEALERKLPIRAELPDEETKNNNQKVSGSIDRPYIRFNSNDMLQAATLAPTHRSGSALIQKLLLTPQLLQELINTAVGNDLKQDATNSGELPYPNSRTIPDLSPASAASALENIISSSPSDPKHVTYIKETVVCHAHLINNLSFQLKVVAFCNNHRDSKLDPSFEKAVVQKLLHHHEELKKKRKVKMSAQQEVKETDGVPIEATTQKKSKAQPTRSSPPLVEKDTDALLHDDQTEDAGLNPATIIVQLQKNPAVSQLIAVYGKEAIRSCLGGRDLLRICSLLSIATYVGLENNAIRLAVANYEACYRKHDGPAAFENVDERKVPDEWYPTFASKAIPALLAELEERVAPLHLPKIKGLEMSFVLFALVYLHDQLIASQITTTATSESPTLPPLFTKDESERILKSIEILSQIIVGEVVARMAKPTLLTSRISIALRLPLKKTLRDDFMSYLVTAMTKGVSSLQVLREILPAIKMDSSNIVSIARLVGTIHRLSGHSEIGQTLFRKPEDGPVLLKLIQKLVRIYASQSSAEPGLEQSVIYKFAKLYFDSFSRVQGTSADQLPPEFEGKSDMYFMIREFLSPECNMPAWCVEEVLAICLQSRSAVPASADKYVLPVIKQCFAYSASDLSLGNVSDEGTPSSNSGAEVTRSFGSEFANYLLNQFPEHTPKRLTSHFVAGLKAGLITYEDLSPRNIDIIIECTQPNGLPLLLLAFEAARADTSQVLKRVKECPPSIRSLVLRVWGAAPARSISTQSPSSSHQQQVVVAATPDTQTVELLKDVAEGVDNEGAIQILKNHAIVLALPTPVVETLWSIAGEEVLKFSPTDTDPIQPETLLTIAIKVPEVSHHITSTLRDRSVSFVSLLCGLNKKVPLAFVDEALAQLSFIPSNDVQSENDEKSKAPSTETNDSVSQKVSEENENLAIKKPTPVESSVGFTKESMATFANAVRFAQYLGKVFFASTVNVANMSNPNHKGGPKRRIGGSPSNQVFVRVSEDFYDRLRSLLRSSTDIKSRGDAKTVAPTDVDKLLGVCGQLLLVLNTRVKMAKEELKLSLDSIRQEKVKIRLAERKEQQNLVNKQNTQQSTTITTTESPDNDKQGTPDTDNIDTQTEVDDPNVSVSCAAFEEEIERREALMSEAQKDLVEIDKTIAVIRSILPSLVKINTDTPSQLEKALASIPPPLRPLAIEEAIGDAVLLKFIFENPLQGLDVENDKSDAPEVKQLDNNQAQEAAPTAEANGHGKDSKAKQNIKFATLFNYIQVLEKYQVYYLPFQEAIIQYASDAISCYETVEGLRAKDGSLPPHIEEAIKDKGIVSSRRIIEISSTSSTPKEKEKAAVSDTDTTEGATTTGNKDDPISVGLTDDLTEAATPAPIIVAPTGTPVDNAISLLKHSLKGGNVADKTIEALTTRLVEVHPADVSRVDHLMRILQCYAESPVNLPQHQIVIQALLNVEDAESEVTATDFARVVATMSRMKSLHLHRSSINHLLESIYSTADSHSQTVIMKALSHDEAIITDNINVILSCASQNIDYYTGDDIENVATALIQMSSYVEFSVIEEFVEQLCSRVLALITTAKKSTLVRMLHLLTHFKLQDVVVIEAIYKSLEEKMPRLDVNQLLTILRSMVELEMPPREVLILQVIKRLEAFVEGMSPAGVVQSLGLMVDLNVAFLPATNALFLRANDFKEQIRQQKNLQQLMERASEEYIIEAPPYVTRHFLKKQKERMRLQALLEIHMDRKALMKLELAKQSDASQAAYEADGDKTATASA